MRNDAAVLTRFIDDHRTKRDLFIRFFFSTNREETKENRNIQPINSQIEEEEEKNLFASLVAS